MSRKIVFMGTPLFAVPILKSLYQNGYPISVVFTQPEKKSKRGMSINRTPIQSLSETLNLEFRTPSTLKNNKEEYNYFKNLNADLAIVVAYGNLIPKEILGLTRKGFINIHASLLPQLRGAAPISRSIMNLDEQTGISIMKITEKLDTGPVCNSYKLDILENENKESLLERLSLLAAEKILENIDNIFEGKAIFKEQDHDKATYAKKIEKSEGKIFWNESAKKIIGKINGLYPFPGAFFLYKGERYKILKAELSNTAGDQGVILNDNFEIGCSKDSIKVLEIQREGKKAQKIKEFLLGTQIKKGTNLNNA
tara:strand:- start:190 stop:1119 length:930 start_codon:yes stop_codon:yes gene_type:complete